MSSSTSSALHCTGSDLIGKNQGWLWASEDTALGSALQVAFIHKPSKSLLTADVISHMAFKKGEGPKPSLPPSGEPCDNCTLENICDNYNPRISSAMHASFAGNRRTLLQWLNFHMKSKSMAA